MTPVPSRSSQIPPREASGRAHRAIASRGRSLRKQEEPLKSPRRKAGAEAGVEERPKARGKASHAACAEGLDTEAVPSEGRVHDLEQDAPEGEDTNEDGCWVL